jgi:hypothetical protein
MGCIFSFLKKNDNNNDINKSLLSTNKYCHNCSKHYTFNEYNRHIIDCKSLEINGDL